MTGASNPNFKHGLWSHPLYRTWRGMMARCYNVASHGYPYYGACGVTVCKRWHDVRLFIADMPARPSAKHTLDRYPDRTGNYEPTNVRWATWKEQNLNRKPRKRHLRGTRCRRGHQYTEENTGIKSTGARYCRTCYRANQRTRYKQQTIQT